MRQATQVALVNRVLDDVDRNTTEVNRNAISTSTCAPIMPSLTRRAISHGLPVQGFAVFNAPTTASCASPSRNGMT
jgi:hypothetical protein